VTERDDETGRAGRQISATEENIELIKSWERSLQHRRSVAERLGDAITSVAASGPVLVLHVVVFVGWILMNGGWIASLQPFDPFPFPLLTTAVSLEAIFLALFVLASQNRLARQSDKRAELDLQIDLLAEREMTAVLQLLQDIASHLRVPTRLPPDQMKDLVNKTDVEKLAEKVDS
jgi:uncharacterized membrane protein